MITIELEDIEYFDGSTNTFEKIKGGTVRFEYSLKVLYDWENKWRKPFLKGNLTEEETIDFYKTMALDKVDEEFLTSEVAMILANYIKDDNTATKFSSPQSGQNGNSFTSRSKTQTAEEIYALMFSAGIPLEFENRNLNRLLAILRIINSHNSQPKKMSKQDIMKQNATINEQRKAEMKTKG